MLKKLFSIEYNDDFKVVTIFGIKISVKSHKLFIKKKLDSINYNAYRANQFSYSNFYLLNSIKEEKLIKKINNGKKIKVLFCINYISKFGMESIYYEMLKDELFDPYIYIVHPRDLMFEENELYFKEALEAYELFKSRGYKTIFAYDINTKIHIPLESISPDIIFYNNPNLHEYSIVKNLHLNTKYLTCYINYSFNISRNIGYNFNNMFINTSWINFVENYYMYTNHMKHNGGYNITLSGYPKLDSYSKPINESNIPKKINNGKKIVVYAPHWTIDTGIGYKTINTGTYHLYHEYFLGLLKKYPDINFVFKPHPDLKYRILGSNIMDINYYENYIKEWDNAPNGIYINDGEYIDLFRKSSCLITDSGSFIAEYLASENPCIYLVNPKEDNLLEKVFSEDTLKILNSYYLAYNQTEIDNYFNEVIINGNDTKKNDRLKQIKNTFINIGSAGKYIKDYIKNRLLDK